MQFYFVVDFIYKIWRWMNSTAGALLSFWSRKMAWILLTIWDSSLIIHTAHDVYHLMYTRSHMFLMFLSLWILFLCFSYGSTRALDCLELRLSNAQGCCLFSLMYFVWSFRFMIEEVFFGNILLCVETYSLWFLLVCLKYSSHIKVMTQLTVIQEWLTINVQHW